MTDREDPIPSEFRLKHPGICRTGTEITFQFDGKPVSALDGETIAAALIAAGHRTFSRGKANEPRGIFCGMGVCHDCTVSIDDGTPQRACLTKAVAGMQVWSRDYRGATIGTEESVRRSPRMVEPSSRTCDVLVVGAGPAGLSAAEILAAHGLHTVVLDERADHGGQFLKPLASSHAHLSNEIADRQYRLGAELVDRVRRAGAELWADTHVWGGFRDSSGIIEVAGRRILESYVWRPRRLILASGAYEASPAFPGWTLPGVMTTGAAQTLCRAYRVAPGRRVLIAGNGPLNLQLACELSEAGVEVAGVIEAARFPSPRHWHNALRAMWHDPSLMWQGARYLAKLRRRSVPVLFGHHIVAAKGEDSVEQAIVASIDATGRVIEDREKSFDIDALCLGYGLRPSSELARTLGCAHETRARGCPIVVRDRTGRTSHRDIYAIGDGAIVSGAHVAMAEGAIAATSVLQDLDVTRQHLSGTTSSSSANRHRLERHRRFQSALWHLFDAPDLTYSLAHPDTPICRCEGTTLATLDTLIGQGGHDLSALKRQSRAGMGRCQGRYCQHLISAMITDATGVQPLPPNQFSPQNPVKPTPIKSIVAEQPEWQGYLSQPVSSPLHDASCSDAGLDDADVVIIGAGIVGVSTAYFLAEAGFDVTVVDRAEINAEASGGNAGSLHLQLLSFDKQGDDQSGPSPAVATLQLQKEGIALWRQLESELCADFELKITGGLMVAETDEDLEFLRRKAELERRQGLGTELIDRNHLRDLVPAISDIMIGAAYCPGEGKINPLLATPAIAEAATRHGANFSSKTTVWSIERDAEGFQLATSRGTLRCKRLVNAAGGWSSNIAAMLGLSLPVQSAPQQMIVTEGAEDLIVPLISHAHRHLTMKQTTNGNLIIGGGWFAGYDQEANRAVTLRESMAGNLWVAQRVLPRIADVHVIRSWAAVGVMIDGAPILGEAPTVPGLFHAVGANGYTMGPIMGRQTADLLRTGRSSIDLEPYAVTRFCGKY